jgi:septum formation protein
MPVQLYLASSSPRRVDILNSNRVPFFKIKNECNNEPEVFPFERPTAYALRLAHLKATLSAGDYKGIILGADTIVEYQGQVFGKPLTSARACSFLNQMSGGNHRVISACALLDTIRGQTFFCWDKATVTFHKKKQGQIESYVQSHTPLLKAGGYGIQDHPEFLSHYTGDVETILGLPIKRLLKIFSHYGIV